MRPRRSKTAPRALLRLALVAATMLPGCGGCGVPDGSSASGGESPPEPSHGVITRREHMAPIVAGLRSAVLRDAGIAVEGDASR